MPIYQKLHKFKLKKKPVIDRQTWSLSDMVFAVPVLAAALANTLSGTGVNLKEKIVWYMYVKNKEDFHLKLICVQVCRCMHVFNICGFNFFLNTFIMIQPFLTFQHVHSAVSCFWHPLPLVCSTTHLRWQQPNLSSNQNF